MTTMVIPSSAKRRSRRMISQSVLSSNPLVTSSSNKNAGRLRISAARQAHFLCPPLSAGQIVAHPAHQQFHIAEPPSPDERRTVERRPARSGTDTVSPDQGTRATQRRPVDIGAAAAAKVTQDHRAVRHLERRVAAGDVRVIQHHLPGQR